MPKDILIFKRIEKKYPTDIKTAEKLLNTLEGLLKDDKYSHSTVCSTYLDTPDRLLIRNSIDAKVYKEKLRIRHYGQLTDDSRLFFEIKKKYKGVVYKRREVMTANEVSDYIFNRHIPFDSQIMRELDCTMARYGYPLPAAFIAYERDAYIFAKDPSVRITLDRNIRYRFDSLFPTKSNDGTPLLSDDQVILEIKTPGGMPLELAHALDKLKLYPTSFSKYGRAYAAAFDTL